MIGKGMLNLEWLRTFKTIYEKGSLTAAAEVLFISQPGASLHLSSFENYVGFRLFERQPRKLIPTERGKLLYNSVAGPLKQLHEIETHFQKSTREDITTITTGMCFETFQISLEKHLPKLDFNLIAEFGEYRELLKKLDQGIIDIVVTPHKIEKTGLIFHPFSQEHIILIAGKGTDIGQFKPALEANNRQEILNWMAMQTWYGIAGDNEHLHRFWQTNFETRPDFRPNFIVPNIHSIVRSLSSSPGWAVIPDFLCAKEIQEGNITLLWKGYKPIKNVLYFANQKQSLHPDQIQFIKKLLQKELPDLET
jgi:DNA-binding transcriptional LysR family regulator